ncbi:MAG: hypothetical protein K6G18_01650 [Treponema sp.]|nr:hypothetical protein [Treponema sp.]
MAKKRYSFVFDAPVSILLVFAYAAVYALDISLRSRMPLPEGQSLISYLFSCSSIDLKAPLDYVRLFSHALGSDGWNSLLLNALLMLILGRSAEEGAGSATLAVMLLLSPLVAGVITCLVPGLSAQGPDPLIFMMLLLNFFICLSTGSISCSWIVAFLAFTAFRAYALLAPMQSANMELLLKACLPLAVSLAGGIAGSLPAFLLLSKSSGSRPAGRKAAKGKAGRKNPRDEATVVASDGGDDFGTLDI